MWKGYIDKYYNLIEDYKIAEFFGNWPSNFKNASLQAT